MSLNRRVFLKKAAISAAAFGTVRLAAAAGTATVSPADAGLVRLLIDSDRDHPLEQLVARIRMAGVFDLVSSVVRSRDRRGTASNRYRCCLTISSVTAAA